MGKKQERRITSGSPGQTRRSAAPTDKQQATISISELLDDRTESAHFYEVNLEYREEPEAQAAAREDNSESEPKNGAGNGFFCATDSPKKWGCKNVFGLSVSYLLVFSVFLGLQNLQSSINPGGLGLASLAVLYASFIVAGFVTPAIVKVLGTKYSLLLGFICHLVYTLTNYYPDWYTLIPSSILIGFASAPLWAAAHTHITKVAVEIAPALRKDLALVISKFTGILFFFFQLAQLPGNLASSLILFPYSNNDTLSNTSVLRNASPTVPGPPSNELCNYLETTTIDTKYLYALVSLYVAFIVVGIVILFFAVDRLPSDNQFFSAEKKFHLYLKEPLIELLQLLKDWRMVMITPMAIFSGMEMAFAFGSFTEIYISECFGTYQVGFTIIALGLSSAVVSIAYGRVIKIIPRFAFVLLGAAVNVILLVLLFVWERVPSYGVIFAFAIGWGAADAVWNNVLCSKLSWYIPPRLS